MDDESGTFEGRLGADGVIVLEQKANDANVDLKLVLVAHRTLTRLQRDTLQRLCSVRPFLLLLEDVRQLLPKARDLRS